MSWLLRQQVPITPIRAVLAGLGATTAIALLLYAGELGNLPLIMAPFGASCVLLFTAADSPLSQPINVVTGHLIATMVGLVFLVTLGSGPDSMALAVGTAIALMRWLRVTHPPAGGNPLVVIAGQESFSFLLFPVLPGAILLVCFTVLYHRFVSRSGASYPHTPPQLPVTTGPTQAQSNPPR